MRGVGLQQPIPQGPPSPHCRSVPGRRLWRGAQRKRRDAADWTWTVGRSHGARGPHHLPHPGGLCLPLMQPVPCWQQIPQTQPGCHAGPAGPLRTGVMEHRAQQAAGKEAPKGAEEGCRAARAECVFDSRATPGWVPVLPCLSLHSYGMGAGGRLWRQRGQTEAWSWARGLPRPGLALGSHLQVAPTDAAPGRGS